MHTTLKRIAIMSASTVAGTSASAQSVRSFHGPFPLVTIEGQVVARLIVDPKARSANNDGSFVGELR